MRKSAAFCILPQLPFIYGTKTVKIQRKTIEFPKNNSEFLCCAQKICAGFMECYKRSAEVTKALFSLITLTIRSISAIIGIDNYSLRRYKI